MDITAFIRELLFGHDCVIIPGFGGFIGNYTPARIDKNAGMFYPPVKQISFNRNLNHNDGLLIGRISKSLKVNYGDARNIVEEFVGGLRKKLSGGEKVVFDHIGSFVNNQEGSVQFEPDRSANYHLDSYGLESFQCIPLEGYDVRKRIKRHVDKDPVKRASLRKVLWRAAVVIPLLVMIVAVPLKMDWFKSKVEATTMNPLVTAELESNKNAVDKDIAGKSIITDETIKPVSDNVPAVSAEPSASEVVFPAAKEESEFCLIIGSFKSEDNAISQVRRLKGEGFTPEILNAPNGFYRVSAMKFNDLNLALSKKDSFSKKFPGAWVKKIK